MKSTVLVGVQLRGHYASRVYHSSLSLWMKGTASADMWFSLAIGIRSYFVDTGIL
jgi:hypothetical protein